MSHVVHERSEYCSECVASNVLFSVLNSVDSNVVSV